MKILILVLSARRQPWGNMMDVSTETWDKDDHPQTQTLYYCGANPGKSSTEKIFYSPHLSESLEDISGRTIEAFEKSLELDWDLMARTHSSCYVHKQNLVDYCETLPRENLLHGLMTSGDMPFLWGGGHYIISRDVIGKFVANKDQWNLRIMEDVSITFLARKLGIPFTENGKMAAINLMSDGRYLCLVYGMGDNFDFTDFEDITKAHPHFFFRVKHDPNRSIDLKIMRSLKKYL